MNHEDEGSVDVELLAECGAIAHRLRSLEPTWSIELKDLHRKILRNFGRPKLPSTPSATDKLNKIYDGNEDEPLAKNYDDNEESDPEFVNRLRFLEDTVIKIHYQQELLNQTGGQKQTAKNSRKIHIKNNMNYSAATKNNNNDLTTSPTGIHELKDDQQFHGTHSCSTTGIVGSSRDHNNKILMNKDADVHQDQNQANCSSNKQQQNIYHQQQQLCAKLNSDDLQMLFRELKRKVDFTEKMNWLCEYSKTFSTTGSSIYQAEMKFLYDSVRVDTLVKLYFCHYRSPQIFLQFLTNFPGPKYLKIRLTISSQGLSLTSFIFSDSSSFREIFSLTINYMIPTILSL